MQIFVIGMHRSGTSVTARLLNLMGAYLGPEDLLMEADRFNPKGYWERKDVYELNQTILKRAGVHWQTAESNILQHLSGEDLANLDQKIMQLLLRLDAHRPWYIKDPRLCLTFPLWRKHLEFPVVIHVYRSPIQIAQSLQTRNGFSLQFGVALWEKHTIASLKATVGCPEFLVSHIDLVTKPLQVVTTLHQQLTELGCRGLRLPHENEVLSFISPALYREQGKVDLEKEFLNQQQADLRDAFLSGKILTLDDRSHLTVSAGAHAILALRERELTLEHECQTVQKALDRWQLKEFESRARSVDLRNRIDAVTLESEQLKNTIQNLRDAARSSLQQIEQIQSRGNQLRQEVYQRFSHWNRHLENNAEALFASWRWKIGCFVVQIAERLMGRHDIRLSADNMRDIFAQIRAYRAEAIEQFIPPVEERSTTTPSSSEAPVNRTVETALVTVDIVVCIHNALDAVQACLGSLTENTPEPYRLFLVNDGSDQETRHWLIQFQTTHAHCLLFENLTAQGYTKAANRGLRATNADYVVLLNSDTVLPRGWLRLLLECADSNPTIGIVGPLSNAASWQSVPECFDSQGNWLINKLPVGYNVNEMADLVHQVSPKRLPRTPFVNGFCFMIKRKAIDRIGYLDEEHFPQGYGEENDYCLRAANAGFSLAIADHAYVYHAKSKSYTHERRLLLAADGDKALRMKHDAERITSLIKDLRSHTDLALVCERVRNALQGKAFPIVDSSLKILFVLPVGGIGGGIHSVVQETLGLRRLGVNAQIATLAPARQGYQRHYPKVCEQGGTFFFYERPADLFSHAAQFDIVIATTWDSPALLQPMFQMNPRILPAYYVQDYEPWFFEKGSVRWRTAYDSYTLIDHMRLFAKTQWLRDTLRQLHGVEAGKVTPSLDNDVYYYPTTTPESKSPIGIVSMIRPSTPRRGADRTMRVFQIIKARFGEQIRIDIFGCGETELENLEKDFNYSLHGVAVKETIADLYRNAEIFVDFSDYQAFGRTGLEAMACGCAVILPMEGGVQEYAIHEENALLVDTNDETALVATLERLITDPVLRQKLRQQGLHTAAGYSIQRAALSELSLLRAALLEHQQRQQNQRQPIVSRNSFAAPISLALLVGLREDGKPVGSANIRLLQPFKHPTIQNEVMIRLCNPWELFDVRNGVIVVQRMAISDLATARQLVEHCLRHGVKLALEIDDDLFNLRLKTGSDVAYQAEPLEAMEFIARHADRVVVSSPALGATLRVYNPHVVCVPNAQDETIWLQNNEHQFLQPPAPQSQRPVRILYMGTRTHEHDLKVVQSAFKQLQKEYGSDRLVLEIVGGIPEHVKSFGAMVRPEGIDPSSDAYTDFVRWIRRANHWHFGIIPLELTPFNRQKSYIKFLDYSALGLASICTDIEPYRAVVRHGENGMLVSNDHEAWYKAMKSLIENPPLRTQLATQAFKDLTEKYILLHRARDFLQAYKF